MRRTIRPFVREFKNRSSKPSARQPAPFISETETKPPLLDLAPRGDSSRDDGYEAALRAADAVFGKKSAEAPPAPPPPAEQAPQTGRVLPSLVETQDAPVAIRERTKKARKPRARKAEKAEPVEEPPAPARRGGPPRRPKVDAPKPAAERPLVKIAPEAPKTSGPRRARRPIQLRWVLRTELRAGEKWKRRLPEKAR